MLTQTILDWLQTKGGEVDEGACKFMWVNHRGMTTLLEPLLLLL